MNASSLKMFFQSWAMLAMLAIGLGSLQAASEESKGADKGSVTPELLAPYLTKDKPVMAEVGAIVPPKEINKYIAKVQAAAQEDPAWHKEFSSTAKPGLPLPWNEKLGLTKDEYEEYLKFWDQRQFKASQQVLIRLEEIKAGEWMIRVSGVGMPISLLRYYPETDMIKSTNGELKRIEDIDAAERSILGAWQGQEWRFEEKTDYVWTKENLAIGKSKDGKYCLLIYRIQENVTAYDKSLVIRFAAPKK